MIGWKWKHKQSEKFELVSHDDFFFWLSVWSSPAALIRFLFSARCRSICYSLRPFLGAPPEAGATPPAPSLPAWALVWGVLPLMLPEEKTTTSWVLICYAQSTVNVIIIGRNMSHQKQKSDSRFKTPNRLYLNSELTSVWQIWLEPFECSRLNTKTRIEAGEENLMVNSVKSCRKV